MRRKRNGTVFPKRIARRCVLFRFRYAIYNVNSFAPFPDHSGYSDIDGNHKRDLPVY